MCKQDLVKALGAKEREFLDNKVKEVLKTVENDDLAVELSLDEF